jgi:hypothetical protein
MAAPGVEQISVQCSCGKRLKAPASAVGKKAKCPKCGNVLTIQAPPPPSDDDGLGALYELAETEKTAATDASIPRCPGCMSPLPAGAVLCTSCGFDTRSGKRLATQKERPAGAAASGRSGASAIAAFGGASKAQPARAEAAPAAEGNYFMGILLGVAFGVGAGLVYGAILHFLDAIPFIGWSVLLVGWLVGVGVDKGYKGGNAVAGMTAAGITLVVVVAVRLIVLALAAIPVVKEAAAEARKEATHLRNLAVTDVIVEDKLKAAGLTRATASQAQLQQFEQEADNQVENLSDADYEKYHARLEPIRTKIRLYNHVHGDVMKEMKMDFFHASDQQRADAHKEAWRRVETLTDAQRKNKLQEYQNKASAAGPGADEEGDEEGDGSAAPAAKSAPAAAAAKSASSSSGSSGSSGSSSKGSGINASLVGFGIVFGLLLLAWFFLPVLVAMALAYKVAANA